VKKVLVVAALAAGVAVAGYRYKQAQREKSLWAEATAEEWAPLDEPAAEPSVDEGVSSAQS
jgi:hypothetical protein